MNRQKIISKLSELKILVSEKKLLLPKTVKIFEVGPRDGLQNEKQLIPTEYKVNLIQNLQKTGLKKIEVGSFVSKKSISQMSDTEQVIAQLNMVPNVTYSALVPNLKGFERAIQTKINEIAVFTAVSESFVRANINCSIQESFDRFAPILQKSKELNLRVRGYVSCVLGCPYEKEVDLNLVNELSHRLLEMGCYEVSLGDTIGVGTPEKTQKLFDVLTVPKDKIAVHFHDTFGNALENILVALQNGVSVVDSSVGGLGGCPYAKKVVGNVCTENVVEMTEFLGIETGVNLAELKVISKGVRALFGREVEYIFE